MKERVEYIDVARGIAMLLVILGHCNQTVDCTLNRFILSFHMPLFFFLSGIFATTTTKGIKNLMGGGKVKSKEYSYTTDITLSYWWNQTNNHSCYPA